MQAPMARRATVSREPARPRLGDEFRSTLAGECERTRELIRFNAELLRTDLRTLSADLRAFEARLTLRFDLMVIAWVAASAVLILNR